MIAGGETLFDYRDYRAAFDAASAAGGVEPLVLGPVDHDRLPALVAEADVFAFPSTKEGFGLAAMEALAAGVPVVVRDLPVLREVFGDAVRYAPDAESLADELAAGLADGRAGHEGARRARRPAAPSPAGTAGTTSPTPTSRSTPTSWRHTRGNRFRPDEVEAQVPDTEPIASPSAKRNLLPRGDRARRYW